MNTLPGGIWPVMLTPFKDDGKIDVDGLRSLTEFYLASGVTGLFANCLSSEMFHLSPEERLTITSTVIKTVAGRVPVVATGTFTDDLKENSEFINRIHDLGTAGVVISSNMLCGESEGEEVFKRKLEDLMLATGEIPLGIYECPVPYKRLISPEVTGWMAESGRFNYFKDTSCDGEEIRAKLKVSMHTGMRLFNANTPTGMQSILDGAAGLSAIGANFYPELYVYLYNKASIRESDELRIVRQFLTLADLVVHAVYPFSAKWFLGQRGLKISTFTRTEVKKPVSEEMIRLKELLAASSEIFKFAGITPAL